MGAICSKCKKQCNREGLEAGFKCATVYRCENKLCQGPVKPEITFFGEFLPPKFYDALDKIADEDNKEDGGCDLMIVMGTALAVPPFCNTIEYVSKECPKVLINLQNTIRTSMFDFCD